MVDRKVKKYDNGMTHIHYYVPFVKTVCMGFFIKAGSSDEIREEQYGIAHFLEHMVFNGSEKYPDTKETDNIIAKLGAYQNAWTWFSETTYFMQSSLGSVNSAFDILYHRVFNPVLGEEDVKKEIGIIQEERVMYENMPDIALSDKIWSQLARGTTYEHTTIGTKESIGDMNAKLLKEFHNTFYSPSNTVFITYGGAYFEDINSIVESDFMQLQKGTDPEHSILLVEGEDEIKSSTVELERDVDITFYNKSSINQPATDLSTLATTIVINSLLSYGNGSLFNKALLIDNSLVSSFNFTFTQHRDYTSMGLETSFPAENKDEFYIIVNGIFDDPNRYLTDKSFERGKKYAYGVMVRSIEGVLLPFKESMVNIEIQNLRHGTDYSYTDLLNELKKVSMDDVRELSEELFSTESVGEGFVTPKQK